MATLKCRFCQKENRVHMYISECNDCRVRYLAIQDRLDPDVWHYLRQTYLLQDPDKLLHALLIDYEDNESVVWVYNYPYDGFDMRKVTFPGIILQIKPEDALSSARRLYRLLAFS